MKYKALVSFSGIVSATIGEVIDIADKEVAQDLLNAKYVEEIKKKTTKKE
jgi:hypothetical protein|nr:MAG TPA: hypothetical protein [Caudoviricetes sp.]